MGSHVAPGTLERRIGGNVVHFWDAAVCAAYGIKPKADPLSFLLAPNKEVAAREAAGGSVARARIAAVCCRSAGLFITEDCVRAGASIRRVCPPPCAADAREARRAPARSRGFRPGDPQVLAAPGAR